eukprot:TRINITY_DN81204_c0_g1_i1.p1 TRINITY_DN81204_c0_g1~~TRINITY_DN81204_c0_g1_i1.p1  ORF type:complete len:473 (+),score=117.48 TRINITY_DN81204_c0_g1_i1:37-1455(+)
MAAVASNTRRTRLSGVSPLARASKRSKQEDVAKILKEADTNGDGLLSLEELQSYLGDYLGYGDKEIRAFFEEFKTAAGGVDLEGLHKGFPSLNPYLISKRTSAFIMRKPGSVCAPGGQMQLEELSDCTVLICDRAEQVFVDECKNCQVLIGPCDSSTFVRDCKNCTFWIATRQLRTRDCVDCKFFLFSHTEPIIETSKEVAFAPFSASYAGLSAHFEQAKLDSGKNFWSAIYDFNGKADSANWSILPLAECLELDVQFAGEGSSSGAWDCPTPRLSHELLCAPPPVSSESGGQSLVKTPQTRPQQPPAPPAGTKAKVTCLSDGQAKPDAADSSALSTVKAAETPSQGVAKPARKLRKPKWTKVERIEPDSRGVNVFVKVVKSTPVAEVTGLSEVVVGDASAVVTLRARGEQVALCQPGCLLRIQNARVAMVKGYIRLEVNKWGVLKPAPEDHEDIEPKVGKDISAVEYERTS